MSLDLLCANLLFLGKLIILHIKVITHHCINRPERFRLVTVMSWPPHLQLSYIASDYFTLGTVSMVSHRTRYFLIPSSLISPQSLQKLNKMPASMALSQPTRESLSSKRMCLSTLEKILEIHVVIDSEVARPRKKSHFKSRLMYLKGT